jgi:vacuolar-type H+-ATPase subunit I/STV1
METQLEITPEVKTALTLVESANSVIIKDIDDYRYAQITMREIKDRIRELTDTRMAQTRPLDESKAKIISFFSGPLEKLEKAKNYLNNIMVRFAEEEESKRREEERRLQEEAKKRAEEEALGQALEAEAAGENQEAEQIISEPVYVPSIKIASEIPKSKESHLREIWDCDAFDLNLTVKAIAEGKAPIESVQYNITFLNAQARAYKSALNIPGTKAKGRKIQI